MKGKVAVITGGNGTLGSAFAKGLVEAGATVYILGKTNPGYSAIGRLRGLAELRGLEFGILRSTEIYERSH